MQQQNGGFLSRDVFYKKAILAFVLVAFFLFAPIRAFCNESSESANLTTEFAAVRDTNTNIVNSMSMITYIIDNDSLQEILQNSPATAVACLNEQGDVVSKQQKVLGSLEDFVSALKGQVIPAFELQTNKQVDIVVSFMNENNIEDVFYYIRR